MTYLDCFGVSRYVKWRTWIVWGTQARSVTKTSWILEYDVLGVLGIAYPESILEGCWKSLKVDSFFGRMCRWFSEFFLDMICLDRSLLCRISLYTT